MRQKLQRLCTSNHLLRLHGKGQNWALLRYLLINIAKIGGPTDTHCQADKVLQDTACMIAKYYSCISMYSLSCKVNTCSHDTVFLCITICKGGMW